RSGPGRRKESIDPIVVRLPATGGGKLRPARALGPTQKSHENKAVTWDVFPAARCYQKTAAAMSAAVWGGNEPNDDWRCQCHAASGPCTAAAARPAQARACGDGRCRRRAHRARRVAVAVT